MTLAQGDPAPDFTLPATGGQRIGPGGGGGVQVLYFYPKADTSGCTSQAIAFQDASPELQARGIDIIGISCDPMPKLERFAAKHDLHLPLASDTKGLVVRAYGVCIEKTVRCRNYWDIDHSTSLIDAASRNMQI